MTTPAQTRVPATGPRRRLQALRLLGWTNKQLALLTGLNTRTIQKTMEEGRATVAHSTAVRVRAVFETHWARVPRPLGSREVRDFNQGIERAQEQGWAPPMAWDDIDDPEEAPKGVPEGPAAGALPVMEALRLLKAGEAPHYVAARLGVLPESLARRLRRHGQHRWAAACERKGM